MTSVDETLSATIAGRVQRVGFRQFAQAQAQTHGLRGWAHNREDGTVEVVVQGPRLQIVAFLDDLRQGTTLVRVTTIHEIWGPRANIPATFEIR